MDRLSRVLFDLQFVEPNSIGGIYQPPQVTMNVTITGKENDLSATDGVYTKAPLDGPALREFIDLAWDLRNLLDPTNPNEDQLVAYMQQLYDQLGETIKAEIQRTVERSADIISTLKRARELG
jgi:hypothetical protein